MHETVLGRPVNQNSFRRRMLASGLLAAAFAVAAELAAAELGAEAVRLTGLRDRLARGILSSVLEAQLLGDPVDRLPGSVHVLFPGAAGETLLFLLDREGIAVSTGSACQAGVPEPSHVVRAMGRTDAEARQVLRFSLGRTSTDEDVDAVLAALPSVVSGLPENLEAVGDAGVVYDRGDALAAALRQLARNPSERVALGERARQRVAELFSVDEMIKRTRSCYDDALQQGR